ncbi:hypothetical protein GCM10027577_09040 [Spirosoma fluminis]
MPKWFSELYIRKAPAAKPGVSLYPFTSPRNVDKFKPTRGPALKRCCAKTLDIQKEKTKKAAMNGRSEIERNIECNNRLLRPVNA